MTTKLQPLFIFSLPRSGSTLVQRILASHEQISTVAEPWILLPYLYTIREKGMYSEYGHLYLTQAVDNFCHQFPNGQDDYLAEMRDFILRLYAKAADHQARYFLDKTPRYHLVVEDVFRLFPEGKFIFLWRNPLAIIASIIETWGDGYWKLYRNKVDIYDGLANLIAAYEKYQSKAYTLQYETLLSNQESELQKVFDYLDLSFVPALHCVPIKLENQLSELGDLTGVKQYQSVSKEPMVKWKHTLANPVRKSWCRKYLHWIGKERLAVMGYDLEELLAELAVTPFSSNRIISDILLMVYEPIYCTFEIEMFKRKCQMRKNLQRLYAHF